MSSGDEGVRKAAELKLWLESRINELREEIGRLTEALSLVDASLRHSTYRPAIEMMGKAEGEIPEMKEIRRDKGGPKVATAAVTMKRLVVEPSQDVDLRVDTPPFKSFLIAKILQGMKSKDDELVAGGKLTAGDVIAFSFEEDGGRFRKLIVDNYRDKGRLNEIINTISWTFSRMLEK